MPTVSTRKQVVLAVIGAVLTTVATGALSSSPQARLVGATLGAAIPVLVASGGAQGIMLSAAITGGALFVTYGGFTLFDYAADKEPTFPIPSVMPPPAENGPSPTVTTENNLSLEWTPESVTCDSDGCDEVTIASTGAEILRIFDIELVGDAAGDFSYAGDCENRNLQRDEQCRISMTFTPLDTGVRNATLRVHQNFQGPATDIAVEGEAGGSPPPPAAIDLAPVTNDVECVYQEGGALVEGQLKDALQIFFSVGLQGEGEPPGAVRVEGKSDLGPDASNTGGIGAGRHVALPLESTHYRRTHTVTVRVDPNNEVPESNEDNNVFRVRVAVPSRPSSSTLPLSCTLS